MPPRAAIFAVGGELETNLFLLPDQLLDLAVLNRLQFRRADLAFLVFLTRLLDRR
jgi:hypothetical protein